MNREILFRGKRKDDGEWIEGFYSEMPYGEAHIVTSKQETKFIFRILSETVGQYTGLTDKNGVKIFEGDIIKTKKYGKISDYIIVNGFDTFTVIYKPCMFRLVNRNRRFNFVNIICNISMKAAQIRAERMEILYKRNKFLISPLERQVFKQFSDFITQCKLK